MKRLKEMKSLRFAVCAVATLLIFALFSTSNAEPGDGKSVYRTLIDLSGMDRETWKSMDRRIKVIAYKTFSTEKKQAFWRLKHEELKKLNWNPEELEHINSLYALIGENPVLMERGVQSEEIEDRFEVFMYNWKEYARDVLGWNSRLVYAVSGSGDEVLNTRGELKVYTYVEAGLGMSLSRSMQYPDDCSCPESEEDENIYYRPHPYSCRMYVMCVWGTPWEMECPDGLFFNALMSMCDWSENSDCMD